MSQITVEKDVGGIKGLCIITPAVHGDSRGCFSETYNRRELAEYGIEADFVQDCRSLSVKGVLRGLHYQKNYPQSKLVRVTRGAVFDVAVDLRPDSETCGRWFGQIISEENRRQIFIPRGFAHGFLVLSELAEFCYKCDDYYHPDDEGGIAWNDPDIAIDWPGLARRSDGAACADAYALPDGTALIFSDRDRSLPFLRSLAIAPRRETP